ncbi:MAG: Tol-Pal system protein TolB [Chlamydiia bacterium]|nr:Tol-Pal system protein TolB [Chlamydiia bacterium]
MRRLCFVLLFLASFQLHAADALSTISVRLKTKAAQTPLFLCPFEGKLAGATDSYAQELASVLAFDLRHSGSIQILDSSRQRLALVQQDRFGKLGASEEWQREGAAYVIQGRIDDGKLAIQLISTVTRKGKGLEGIRLTGVLAEDRRAIHLVADAFHREIFGVDGIASSKLLYCLVTPNPKPSDDKDMWLSEVWESDYDGHNAHQLTYHGKFCVTPCYLPPKAGHASNSFLYVSYQAGQPKIYLGTLKGGKPQRLTTLAGNQLMPCMTSQRDHIAFICDAAGNPDLFLLPFNPDSGPTGKPMQIYSSGYATQASPSFSPDGNQVAFVSNKDGTPRIYVMDVPRTRIEQQHPNPILITARNRENTSPAWSPDGAKIAYSSRCDGVRQICIYDVAKGEEWQLTHGPGHKENPSWAPDSKHIVFNSVDGHASELFMVNLSQGDVVQVSRGPGEKKFPSWDPAWR